MRVLILAYNREKSLAEMLKSLLKQNHAELELTVFLDYSPEIDSMIETIENVSGGLNLKIVPNKQNQGVENQMQKAFEDIHENGSAIVLEDDLQVHPNFLEIAAQRIKNRKDSDSVMLSFYHQHFYHQNYFPFHSLSELYRLQLPSSWGFYMTSEAARDYLDFSLGANTGVLPQNIESWSKSWKKPFVHYLIETNRYVDYANSSLTGPSGVSGNHEMSTFYASSFQLEPNVGTGEIYDYDAFMEMEAKHVCGALNVNSKDLCVDLWGTKPLEKMDQPYLLSAKKCSKPIRQFGVQWKPIELNVLWNSEGSDLSFGETKYFQDSVHDFAKFHQRFEAYGMTGNRKNLIKKALLNT